MSAPRWRADFSLSELGSAAGSRCSRHLQVNTIHNVNARRGFIANHGRRDRRPRTRFVIMCANLTNKEVTQILLELRHGEETATERLLAAVYDELKKLAQAKMRAERSDHTLQPTALVHEAYMRLMGGSGDWDNRAHFFAAAAEAMRRILVDHARGRGAQKRGAGRHRVDLDALQPADGDSQEMLAVDEALGRLEQVDRQKAEVVKLRFFAGLTIEETAAVLGVSVRTINRIWNYSKAWLYREIQSL